jgi:glucosamine--fructose-6-phosphate aminotransferase (isomerizing)
MCGITCYYGQRNASEFVVEGLKKLEYRGYDSWGIGVLSNSKLSIHKEVGKISDFKGISALPRGNIAIGHTRWATHGPVTKENAHPHTNFIDTIAVVHNGIIENFQELKAQLKHHNFRSDTDTEIVAHLIGDNISAGMDFEAAFRNAISALDGRFAIVAVTSRSDKMLAAKKGSPLVIGLGDDEHFIASDILAFADHTRNAVFMEDGDIVVVEKCGVIFKDMNGKTVSRRTTEIDWNLDNVDVGNHAHFMIKEILEQRMTIKKAISHPDSKILKVARMINDAFGTFFIGCGTAGKVGMVGSYIFSSVAKKHVNDVVGSEFPNYHHFLTDKTLLVCISQSGETADTLEAIEVAKKHGCKVVSIVNVEGSTMARMSDEFILCNSGPEKAVCSTKVTTAQIAILTLLAYACAGRLDEGRKIIADAAENVDRMLDGKYLDNIRLLAKRIAAHESMYIIGRSLNYPMALEAAIKMQEVPYIHAEGFAGGELKHGPIALIQKGTPCISLVANDNVKKEILINAMEIKSRGGFIIGVAPKNNEVFDFHIPVPEAGIASPIVNIIPIQILSYYTALERSCDPDRPRNLAKSVTVK